MDDITIVENDEEILLLYKVIASLNDDHGVYLVQDERTGRVYVKKEMEMFDRAVYQTLYENKIRGIPGIICLFEKDCVLTVIEEYIPGDTLAYLVESNGLFEEDAVKGIIQSLCRIMEKLHSLDPPVIHRDIKPENLIMSQEGNLFLIDFDTARLDDERKSRDTVLLGTEGYAAPEQYGFGSSDITTDIYAIGMVMNYLLTGEVSRDSVVHGRFHDIITRCLAMERDKRFGSVKNLSMAIDGKKEWKLYGYARFLPPGFRTGHITHMVTAMVGYFVIFTGASGIYESSLKQGTNPWVPSIGIAIGMLLVVAFTCNYLGMMNSFPLINKVPSHWRIPIIIIFDVVFFAVYVVLLVIFLNLMGM